MPLNLVEYLISMFLSLRLIYGLSVSSPHPRVLATGKRSLKPLRGKDFSMGTIGLSDQESRLRMTKRIPSRCDSNEAAQIYDEANLEEALCHWDNVLLRS